MKVGQTSKWYTGPPSGACPTRKVSGLPTAGGKARTFVRTSPTEANACSSEHLFDCPPTIRRVMGRRSDPDGNQVRSPDVQLSPHDGWQVACHVATPFVQRLRSFTFLLVRASSAPQMTHTPLLLSSPHALATVSRPLTPLPSPLWERRWSGWRPAVPPLLVTRH